MSCPILYLFFLLPVPRKVILTWAESRTNFLGGSMCCCTTTGESVMGITSLFSGVTIFWTLNSSIAERAQECPSTRVVIWRTDRYYPKLGHRHGLYTSMVIFYYLPFKMTQNRICSSHKKTQRKWASSCTVQQKVIIKFTAIYTLLLLGERE